MSKKTKNNEIYLYHGTTEKSAKTIMEHGFKPDTKYNWNVKSKKGFVYLSVSYAPFYAMNSGKGRKALVKVKINLEDAYPEDDFIMYALGKGKYTQEELDEINLEDFKQYAFKSLRYMGNVAVKPKDVEVVGYTSFDDKRLWQVCDPVMSPLNFKILGVYYKELSDWIYSGEKPEDFPRTTEWMMKGTRGVMGEDNMSNLQKKNSNTKKCEA